MRYYPAPFTRDQTRRWIENNIERYTEDGYGLWAMELLATGEFAGNCGLVARTVGATREVEIGWHVARHLWGRGLAPEAALACRDRGRAEFGIDRFISLIRPINWPSRRVAEKIGMRVEKLVSYGPQEWPHLLYVWPPPTQPSRPHREIP
jgi:[ribosomal protein S5]-alanine N-acetyltransferase